MQQTAYSYRNGTLYVDEVEVMKIVREVGTPFYLYSTHQLQNNYKKFIGAFKKTPPSIFYAIKANANLDVIHCLANSGAGADITSQGELERALRAGIPGKKIIYSGVGKREEEIKLALLSQIYQFNVESIPELRQINTVAQSLGCKASFALRVNPNVAARTHKKTSTGELGTKFGIDIIQLEEAMREVTALTHCEFVGFQVHIGSHVYDYEPFREAFRKLAELVHVYRNKGFSVRRLNLGGGVGIPYDGQSLAPFEDYAAIVEETLGGVHCELLMEPGRRLVGDAGLLICRVIYDKQGAMKRFLIVDAGMNDLVRPAMYDARHSIIPIIENTDDNAPLADVVGPVCETSDLFGEDYRLPGVQQNDYLAILQAGAYSASMSSTYNGRALIPEIMVTKDSFKICRRRISVQEQMGWETFQKL